ncbi:MAG: hypothetical protein WCJ64_20455 [Rhodospirillaceae bacterium]
MSRRTLQQLALDLEPRVNKTPPSAPPEGLLRALADLLLEALGQQKQVSNGNRETNDAAQDHE